MKLTNQNKKQEIREELKTKMKQLLQIEDMQVFFEPGFVNIGMIGREKMKLSETIRVKPDKIHVEIVREKIKLPDNKEWRSIIQKINKMEQLLEPFQEGKGEYCLSIHKLTGEITRISPGIGRNIKTLNEMSTKELQQALQKVEDIYKDESVKKTFKQASFKLMFARKEVEEQIQEWIDEIDLKVTTDWNELGGILEEEARKVIGEYDEKLKRLYK